MKVSSKKAFTMIELIFVIVIIGILAAVAIPKLAATRDDAKISKSIANLKICIRDAGAAYTGRVDMDLNKSSGCQQTMSEACFTLTSENNTSLVVGLGTNDEPWCVVPDSNNSAQGIATNELNLTGIHVFGGVRVVR